MTILIIVTIVLFIYSSFYMDGFDVRTDNTAALIYVSLLIVVLSAAVLNLVESIYANNRSDGKWTHIGLLAGFLAIAVILVVGIDDFTPLDYKIIMIFTTVLLIIGFPRTSRKGVLGGHVDTSRFNTLTRRALGRY